MVGATRQSVSFDPVLIRRYDGRGPRYTSYPTALQFDPAFRESDYRSALAACDDEALSLYVHIPFCESLCYYCGCHKIVTRNADRIEAYLHALREEIRLQSAALGGRRRVEQLHFGGGTPTYLSDQQLEELMRWLRAEFDLDVSTDREFSIEVDPRTVGERSLETLADLGFNRISLGIQDFDPAVQRAVNREQTVEQIEVLIDAARTIGYGSISFDLIYGLPHQSVTSFDRTLAAVTKLRPDRIAVYNYAHLPERFKGQRMIREDELPTAEEKLYILGHTISTLTLAGYDYIGMDHFALPDDELSLARRDGTLQRNFQGYSTRRGCSLVALGVSAISRLGTTYAQNTLSTNDYAEIVQSGHIPVSRGLTMDADDQVRAAVIHDIMCRDGLDFSDFEERHQIDFCDYFCTELSRLEPLADDGLVSFDRQHIEVTPAGRLLLRSIAMVFDRYFSSAEHTKQFSKAI